jgi:thiol-disulfide isomerase/thioredoxin
MRYPWIVPIAVAAVLVASRASAQATIKTKPDEPPRPSDPKKVASSPSKFASRQALNDFYQQKFADLDKQRIADLGALAPKLKDPESEAAYAEAFNLAVTRDQYEAAEGAAEAFLESGKGTAQTKALASFINIIAASNRGQYDQAVKDLDAFLKGQASSTNPEVKVDPNLTFAVGEAFVQRLIKAGEYETARKVCTTFIDDSQAPNIKEHFAARLSRIDMLGKPAPDIVGTDVDGKKVSLSDYQGKVVLVDFWATWAPPCVAQIPYYSALEKKYGSSGFQVVGVNVDSDHQSVKDRASVTPGVRRFLLTIGGVTWPTIVNGTGKSDFARAFGVTDIPANFLIDRSGKIIQVELSDVDLDKAIQKALGGGSAKPAPLDRNAR